jgi:hypothetical protein
MGILEKLLQMKTSVSCITSLFGRNQAYEFDNSIFNCDIVQHFVVTDQELTSKPNNSTCIKIPKHEYNKLLLSIDFWKLIKSTHTLIYDIDISFFKQLDPIYFDYDFVAGCRSAQEIHNIQRAFNTPFLPIIGSSILSLRKTKLMLDILSYKNSIITNREDIYTSLACYSQYKKLPATDIADAFCYERGWIPNTFAGLKKNVIITK